MNWLQIAGRTAHKVFITDTLNTDGSFLPLYFAEALPESSTLMPFSISL